MCLSIPTRVDNPDKVVQSVSVEGGRGVRIAVDCLNDAFDVIDAVLDQRVERCYILKEVTALVDV